MPDCTLTPEEHADALSQAFRDGYESALAVRGGITNPCPGSGWPPSKITREILGPFSSPYRGLCASCGREYTLNDRGLKVRKHRRHDDA